ncbi:MAG: hypothetical protein ACFBZ8_10995 [Opitutales bacterium]
MSLLLTGCTTSSGSLGTGRGSQQPEALALLEVMPLSLGDPEGLLVRPGYSVREWARLGESPAIVARIIEKMDTTLLQAVAAGDPPDPVLLNRRIRQSLDVRQTGGDRLLAVSYTFPEAPEVALQMTELAFETLQQFDLEQANRLLGQLLESATTKADRFGARIVELEGQIAAASQRLANTETQQLTLLQLELETTRELYALQIREVNALAAEREILQTQLVVLAEPFTP